MFSSTLPLSLTCITRLFPYSTLEINIGLLCACLVAFPAFLDRYWPHSLHHYVSRLTSYFSSSHVSKSDVRSGAGGAGANIALHDTSNEYVGSNSEYLEIHDERELAKKMRGDMARRTEDYSTETTVSIKGVNNATDLWRPLRGVGVVKTVDVEQNPLVNEF